MKLIAVAVVLYLLLKDSGGETLKSVGDAGKNAAKNLR